MRQLERVLAKVGRLQWETSHVGALAQALPPAPPRFLVRIDEFPHYLSRDDPSAYGTEFMREFMAALVDVPPLVAVVPRLALGALDPNGTDDLELQPGECEFLAEPASAAVHSRSTDSRTGHVTRARDGEAN